MTCTTCCLRKHFLFGKLYLQHTWGVLILQLHVGLGVNSATELLSYFLHKSQHEAIAVPSIKLWFVVQGEEQGAMSISLPRVSSAELLLFPETAEGHVSKVVKALRLPAMPSHPPQGFADGARQCRSLNMQGNLCCTVQYQQQLAL